MPGVGAGPDTAASSAPARASISFCAACEPLLEVLALRQDLRAEPRFHHATLRALLQEHERRVHRNGGHQQRDEADDQAVALRRVPEAGEAPGAQKRRRGDRRHDHERLDARQAGQVPVPGERPDGRDRHAPGGQERQHHALVAAADAPARHRQADRQDDRPDERGVQADQAQRHGHPVGLPRVGRELQDVDRGLPERGREERLVGDDGDGRRGAGGRVLGQKGGGGTAADERGWPAAVEERTPPLDRRGDQDHGRQDRERREQKVGRMPGERAQGKPVVDRRRQHGLAAGRERQDHQRAGCRDEDDGGECRERRGFGPISPASDGRAPGRPAAAPSVRGRHGRVPRRCVGVRAGRVRSDSGSTVASARISPVGERTTNPNAIRGWPAPSDRGLSAIGPSDVSMLNPSGEASTTAACSENTHSAATMPRRAAVRPLPAVTGCVRTSR